VNLPPVVQVNTVGPGDEFILQIVGEKNLPKEFVVAPDGTVALPFVNRVKVAGLEAQQIESVMREKLIAGGYFRAPVVVARVKAFTSKRVVVVGEVKKPDSLPYVPGMTLASAIAKVGGVTSLARTWKVVLVRKTGTGNVRVVVDVDAINNNQIPDVPLQAGDRITVPQRVM